MSVNRGCGWEHSSTVLAVTAGTAAGRQQACNCYEGGPRQNKTHLTKSFYLTLDSTCGRVTSSINTTWTEQRDNIIKAAAAAWMYVGGEQLVFSQLKLYCCNIKSKTFNAVTVTAR